MRYGHQCHIGHIGKECSLLLPVACRSIPLGSRILIQTRALATAILPTVARLVDVSTMSCHQPEIVHCDDRRDILLPKVVEQHRVIDVVPMDIMQMHHIGTNYLQLLQKLTGCPTRHQPMTVQILRGYGMQIHAGLGANPDQLQLALSSFASVRDIALPSLSHSPLPQLFDYATG